jgi:hypothetical protein
MTKEKIIIIVAIATIFLTASISSFLQARKQYTSPSEYIPPEIMLIDPPATFKANNPITLTWKVNTKSPYKITDATIFYDTIATPSALTPDDPPKQVGYRYSIPDYRNNLFTSPETFTTKLTPPTDASVIFLRAYVKLDNHHYWTPEHTLKKE